MAEGKFSDTLVLLISNANIVPEGELLQVVSDAKRMAVPVERALIMSGRASDASLQNVLRAREMIHNNQISAETAVKAIRLCTQNQGMTVDQAVRRLSSIHSRTSNIDTVTSQIGMLLMQAGIIDQDQLAQALRQSEQTKIPLGRILRLNRIISNILLAAVINAQILVRERKVTREQAIDALRLSSKKKCSIEQSLFELGCYKHPDETELKLSDLFSMSGLITESDRLECLELEIIKHKPLAQVLLEQGLVSPELLETAQHLQTCTASGEVRAFQAAEALKQVALKKVSVYQALAEVRTRAFSARDLRLGELLIETGLVQQSDLDKALAQQSGSNVKLGKLLLSVGLLTQARLFDVLRCQSLLRCGFISDVQALAMLRHVEKNRSNLEEAFNSLGWYAPSSMQWLWV